jgi:hypothetical protein
MKINGMQAGKNAEKRKNFREEVSEERRIQIYQERFRRILSFPGRRGNAVNLMMKWETGLVGGM